MGFDNRACTDGSYYLPIRKDKVYTVEAERRENAVYLSRDQLRDVPSPWLLKFLE
jgi:hypothetical protein